MTSSTNERTISRRNEQASRDRLTDEIITKALMSTEDGRRWVWLRLSEGRLWDEDENFDPGSMAFAKGRRNAALRLLKDVQAFTPSEYVVMANEAQKVEAYINKKEPNYVGSADFADLN